jgi:cytochrome b561
MFGLGWYMTGLPLTDPLTFELFQRHKTLGIIVLVLVLLRLVWRLTHRPPPWPETMRPWEHLAASGAHWALYALLLFQPIVGILQSNAANFPIVLWGVLPLPALIGQNEALGELLVNLHHLGADALLIVVILHVAAALRHHFWLKDNVLRRMLPFASAGR